MLAIRLLGPFSAVDDSGTDLQIGGPQSRAILALLATAWPQSLSLDRIIDGIWGEDPPASARNSVQVRVTGLRKPLQTTGAAIVRVGSGYSLQGEVSVDVVAFEQLVRQGRSALRSGESARSQRLLEDALALWRGPALDDLGSAPFVHAILPSLEQSRCDAWADLARANLRESCFAEAIGAARELLARRPYDERGWVALAVGQYWSGQQDAALHTCRQAQETLAAELGLDPTEELGRLQRQILDHQVPMGPAAGDTEPGQAAAPLPDLPFAFAGRDAELDDLADRQRHGQRLITLVGIGGIGKTSLAVALAHRVSQGGARCVLCDLTTATLSDAALHRICQGLGVEPGDDPAGALERGNPSAALILDNAEQVAGLGLVLDRLLAACPGLSIVVTSRRPTGAQREHLVFVSPLAPEAARSVLVAHAERVRPGVAERQPADVSELAEILDSIPLAIELAAGRIRSLTPQQLVLRFRTRKISVLDGWSGIALPQRQASLNAVLQESWAALPTDAKALFEVLGSFEGWVSLELLQAVAADLVGDPEPALDELVACGLVRLDVDGRIRMQGPIREFARALGDREQLDARVVAEAVALAQRHAPELIGSSAPQAVAVFQRDQDTLVMALSTAAARGDAPSASALALALNRYWLLNGEISTGRSWIERVARMTGLAPETQARMDVLAGTFASYQNDPEAAGRLQHGLRTCRALDLPVDRLIVNGWCCLAALAAHQGDLTQAQRWAAHAAEEAGRTDDPMLHALARDLVGHVASYAGDYETSLTVNLAGLADARRCGDRYDVANLLANTAIDLSYLDRAEESLAYAEEAFDLVTGMDQGPLHGTVLMARGVALACAGQPDAARIDLLEALRVAHLRHPDPLMTADLLQALGVCLAPEPAGSAAEAARCLGAAAAIYREQGLADGDRLPPMLLRQAQSIVDDLGPARYATLSALGGSDPEHTVVRLLRRVDDGHR